MENRIVPGCGRGSAVQGLGDLGGNLLHRGQVSVDPLTAVEDVAQQHDAKSAINFVFSTDRNTCAPECAVMLFVVVIHATDRVAMRAHLIEDVFYGGGSEVRLSQTLAEFRLARSARLKEVTRHFQLVFQLRELRELDRSDSPLTGIVFPEIEGIGSGVVI